MTGRHRDFLPIVLGTFVLVAAYGVLNDQWVVSISPQHFTIYQEQYFPFAQPWAQALCFGLIFAGVPGLAWGAMLYWAGHYGPGPVVGTRATLIGAAVVVIITAVLAWSLGWHASSTGAPVYSTYFYPSEDVKLYISETVQLTNLWAGVAGATLWLLLISIWRTARKSPPPVEQ